MKKIVILFDKRGGSKIEAFGFQGGECLAATKSIEDAIGAASGRKMKTAGDGDAEAKQVVTQ